MEKPLELINEMTLYYLLPSVEKPGWFIPPGFYLSRLLNAVSVLTVGTEV